MKNKTVHNETPDSKWYWIVEQTDGYSWTTIATGFSDTEEEANNEAEYHMADRVISERMSDREFGMAIVSSFELKLMESGVNSNLEFAEAVDSFFNPISSALERGRLHIALKRIEDILNIEESSRPFAMIASDANFIPIYNAIAIRINLPRR